MKSMTSENENVGKEDTQDTGPSLLNLSKVPSQHTTYCVFHLAFISAFKMCIKRGYKMSGFPHYNKGPIELGDAVKTGYNVSRHFAVVEMFGKLKSIPCFQKWICVEQYTRKNSFLMIILWCLSPKQEWGCNEWWVISSHLLTEMTKAGSWQRNPLSMLFPMRFPAGCGLCLAGMLGHWSKMLSCGSSTLSFLDEARQGSRPRWRNRVCFVLLVFFLSLPKTSLESKNCCLREAYRV